MPKSWLPLEANPDVLSTYAHFLGMSDKWSFHDVLSVEPWAVEMVPQPVKAILLLFPISPMSEKERETCITQNDTDVYFMKQTVGNACGTIAILHTLLNLTSDEEINPGSSSYVKRMMERTKSLSPAERGIWLENDSEIEQAHLSSQSLGQSTVAGTEDVDTHFVAFLRKGKSVLELDGRREGPVVRGTVESDAEFASEALNVIKREFMDRNPDDVRFSILALAPAVSESV